MAYLQAHEDAPDMERLQRELGARGLPRRGLNRGCVEHGRLRQLRTATAQHAQGWPGGPVSDRTLSLALHCAVDGVSCGCDARGPDFRVTSGDRSPEVVERPTLLGEVGKEGERKPQCQMPLDWPVQRLVRYLVNGSECSGSKLRHAESHGEH